MFLKQIAENSPFTDIEDPLTKQSFENKVRACTEQEYMLVDKIRRIADAEIGNVFVTDASATKMPASLSAALAKDRNAFISFVLSSSNPDTRTKVWINKTNIALVRRVRAIIDRHNKLSNTKAEFQGKLAELSRTKKANETT